MPRVNRQLADIVLDRPPAAPVLGTGPSELAKSADCGIPTSTSLALHQPSNQWLNLRLTPQNVAEGPAGPSVHQLVLRHGDHCGMYVTASENDVRAPVTSQV